MSIKKDILLRVGIVYVCLIVLAIAIVIQLFSVQFVQGSKWRSRAMELSTKNISIDPNRGDILSSDGRLLASSVPFYEIRIDTKARGLTREIFKDNIDSLSLCLSQLFGDKPKSEYKRELINARQEGLRYFLLKRKVDYIQLKKLRTFPMFRLGKNKGGLMAVQTNLRIKPHGSLATRTVGNISKSDVGNIVGIEGAYDKELRGVQGIRLMQRLSGGVWMPINDRNEVEPVDGYDVTTTIDINIQDVAESALRRQLTLHDAHHGCAILMEVKTGEIKAITSLEKDESGIYLEKYNYALGESAEPGSTFKLASMISLLEDGYIDLGDTVDTGEGFFMYKGKKIKDSEDKGLGKITMLQAFEHSSNVAISKKIIQYYTGRESLFIDRLYRMKLNQKLGIEIRGEGKPEIKYPGDRLWSGWSLPMMSIGYEVRLAPIHILTFYNAVANDGEMVKPSFVKSISQHGYVIRQNEPEIINPSICSSSTIKKLRKMLEGVVDSGTAKNLRDSVLRIAGKTGTAQIAKGKAGYDRMSYQASFVGYFPADNPKYSCIVVVNSPSNSVYYGNVVAGPVFKEIADKVYATSLSWHSMIKPEKHPIVDIPYSKTGNHKELELVMEELRIPFDDNADAEWVTTNTKNNKVELKSRTVINHLVPNVVDMGLKDALYLLENAGLKVIVKGRGKVIKQSIAPGTKTVRGGTIYLDMSFG
jgi:cell division protein FtsI (penicillin-binding protein 3)